jgi:signal transduction histidine kinase
MSNADKKPRGDPSVSLPEKVPKTIDVELCPEPTEASGSGVWSLPPVRWGNVTAAIFNDARNALATLSSNVDWLHQVAGEELPNPEVVDAIDDMRTTCRRLSALLVEMHRAVRSGAIAIVPEPVELRALIDEAIERVRRAQAAAVRTRIDVVCAVEQVMIADSTLARRIVESLLDNAARFSPPQGRVVVTAGTKTDSVTISVADEGPGMAPQVTAQALAPPPPSSGGKLRAAEDGKAVWNLSMCRALARGEGGDLTIDSARLGGGVIVTLTLPLRSAVLYPFA